MTKFFVILPTLNASAYLDRLLATLVFQKGQFILHIHIQDCNSSDATQKIVERWQSFLQENIVARNNIQISFCSEQDTGLYDAISRASKQMDDSDCLMTWIGADDVLLPGSLATVASVFMQHTSVMWLTGVPQVANDDNEMFTQRKSPYYSRYHLYAGHYDGRGRGDNNTYAFVMQEGTFWRRHLWDKVGGVDTGFKLAGDWDLWRRFAEHYPLHCFTFPVACFSRRAGQKSSDMKSYYAEIDRIGYRKPPFLQVKAELLVRYAWEKEWKIYSRHIKIHERLIFGILDWATLQWKTKEKIRAF